MNVYGIYLATLHQQDLLEQARLYHRAKLAPTSPGTVPAWRRSLSGLLASAASTIDPTVKVERVAPAC
jgi:hypothetical protein